MKKNHMHRGIVLAGMISLFLFVSGCGFMQAYQEIQFFAMDTLMQVELSGKKSDIEQIRKIVEDLEDDVSVTDVQSELYQINHRTVSAIELSKPIARLLNEELAITETTNGALNPALYPISCAWGFTTDHKRVPSAEELAALLPKTDWRQIQLSNQNLTLPDGMELDFGATAKGFASDLCADYLREQGIKHALLNFGGNTYTIGTNKKGEYWKIGIRDPWDETAQGMIGVLESTNEAVITSGSYERYFEQDGVRYHHIMDGTTGLPVRTGLVSVTIVCESGVKADGLSTALFVMGLDQASNYWRQYKGFEAIFVTEDGKQYYTEGLENRYHPTQGQKAEVIRL